MEFSEYINQLSGGRKISAVKLKILITLWESSQEFPKAWVTSDHLLEITGQKYFDRRARELRDE
ncbi:MAG: HNH endonuclease, partial [bacterium]